METGNNGNSSKASTKLERPPLHASLQCERVPACREKSSCADLLLSLKSRALGESRDLNIAKETLEYMWTEAKDQDFHYFFFGLSNNVKTKRLLRSYVFENYDKV